MTGRQLQQVLSMLDGKDLDKELVIVEFDNGVHYELRLEVGSLEYNEEGETLELHDNPSTGTHLYMIVE